MQTAIASVDSPVPCTPPHPRSSAVRSAQVLPMPRRPGRLAGMALGEVAAALPAGNVAPGLGDEELAALIARIARQDERALEALYDAAASRVHALVLRIVSTHALADEVLEDTFWQVWRQAPRFDAVRGRPITWLLALARSRAIEGLRAG